MPIQHRIDHERRIVFATGHGEMTDEDLFRYQREVWSDPALAGYDEVVDMSDVTSIPVASGRRAPELAEFAARMDAPGTSARLAIVAPSDFVYGMARMYATYRGMQSGGTKQVEVFRSMAEAMAWLGRAPTE